MSASGPLGGAGSAAGGGGDVTQLLVRAQRGDRAATNDLFPVVYNELRTLASRFMADERANHTLQATALVNEAYLRLVGPSDVGWESRAHFFGAAAQAIRRILTDHARAKGSVKRGGGAKGVELSEDLLVGGEQDEVDFVELDAALQRLAALDERKARVVELRYFAGLTGEQTALAMGVSASTVAREWEFARAWLHRELSRANEGRNA